MNRYLNREDFERQVAERKKWREEQERSEAYGKKHKCKKCGAPLKSKMRKKVWHTWDSLSGKSAYKHYCINCGWSD